MMTTTIRWDDGDETTMTWIASAWWEVVKKARDRFIFQRSMITQIEVQDGPVTHFLITDTMDETEVMNRIEQAETTYRTELAAFNDRYGF